jgi:hypothetical protein
MVFQVYEYFRYIRYLVYYTLSHPNFHICLVNEFNFFSLQNFWTPISLCPSFWQQAIKLGFGVPLKLPLISILLNVFLNIFHLVFEVFCHQSLSFEEVYIPFKCFAFFSNLVLFFQKLSKFVHPLSFNIIFRFDLHHIQMDVTQFSYCHGVLMYITTNHNLFD